MQCPGPRGTKIPEFIPCDWLGLCTFNQVRWINYYYLTFWPYLNNVKIYFQWLFNGIFCFIECSYWYIPNYMCVQWNFLKLVITSWCQSVYQQKSTAENDEWTMESMLYCISLQNWSVQCQTIDPLPMTYHIQVWPWLYQEHHHQVTTKAGIKLVFISSIIFFCVSNSIAVQIFSPAQWTSWLHRLQQHYFLIS